MRLARLAAVEGQGGMPGKSRFIREFGPAADQASLREAAEAAAKKGRPAEQRAVYGEHGRPFPVEGMRLEARLHASSFWRLSDSDIVVAVPGAWRPRQPRAAPFSISFPPCSSS